MLHKKARRCRHKGCRKMIPVELRRRGVTKCRHHEAVKDDA